MTIKAHALIIPLLISLPLWGGAIGGILGGYINDLMIQKTGSRRWGRSLVGFTGKFIACGLMFVAISQDDGVAAALERLLDEISFSAPDRDGEEITIDEAMVRERLEELTKNADLSKFIL